MSRSPAPEPILQRQLIDLQMSGESREKHKGIRDNQSPVAQDVEKRALQRAWLCFQAASTLFCHLTSTTRAGHAPSPGFGGAHVPATP